MKQKKLRLTSEDDYNKIAVRKQPSEVNMDDMQVRVSIEIDAKGFLTLKDFHTSINHRIQLSDDVDEYIMSLTNRAMDDIKNIYYSRYDVMDNLIKQQRCEIRDLEMKHLDYITSIKNMSLYKLIIHWLSLRK